ncbi:alkaline-phosphatase-like protein [Xylariomycetidae sp. FL2044]|nr:alkaline-phosphatase-like protein [Xylariomycetidae sp. FL2044]
MCVPTVARSTRPRSTALAKEGIQMTGIHAASACTPTRSMLMSGTDNHIASVGQMAEFMKNNGYLTIMSGKCRADGVEENIRHTEGGIRCPCIVRHPKFAKSRGVISHEFAAIMGILPTVLDMAGIAPPATRFRRRDVVTPRGISWVPHLDGRAETVHENGTEEATGWELFGQRAIQRGRWKAVFTPGPDKWELFDLSRDLGELHNLSKGEPGVMRDLMIAWERYYQETGMYDPQYRGCSRGG